MTISPNRRSTKRGRPPVYDGVFRCSRCQRLANQRRASWPGEQLCYSCFYSAMHTRGVCPQCGHDGILAGHATDAIRQPICLSCARIPGDFTCRGCGNEGDFYRRGTCSRCSLRQDLTALMIDGAQRPRRYGPDRGGVVPGRSARQHPELETLAPSSTTADRPGQRDDPFDPCRPRRSRFRQSGQPSAQHARTRRCAGCS